MRGCCKDRLISKIPVAQPLYRCYRSPLKAIINYCFRTGVVKIVLSSSRRCSTYEDKIWQYPYSSTATLLARTRYSPILRMPATTLLYSSRIFYIIVSDTRPETLNMQHRLHASSRAPSGVILVLSAVWRPRQRCRGGCFGQGNRRCELHFPTSRLDITSPQQTCSCSSRVSFGFCCASIRLG